MASDIGKELIKHAKQNSSAIKTQAGQAGAVPSPDTAPLTGAPHEAEMLDGYRNDVVIHIGDVAINNGSMADAVEESMENRHGTNGTSYSNH